MAAKWSALAIWCSDYPQSTCADGRRTDGLIAATVHAIKSPIEDWRWSVIWMLVVIADAALMSSTVRYRSFKDFPMAARQKSFLVIVMALLVWWIFADSEDALMIIATVFVASGVTLHVIRVVRHYLVSHPAKT